MQIGIGLGLTGGGDSAGLPTLTYGTAGVYAGDSITAFGASYTTSGAGSLAHAASGYATWAQALTAGRLSIGASGNQGVSGNQSDQLLARFAATTAQSPRVCVVEIGTNDVTAVNSAGTAITYSAACIANIAEMIRQLRANRCRVILVKVMPRGSVGTPMTANQITAWETINAWIATQAASDLTVVDTESDIGNGDAAHTIKTTCTYDDLHPNATGAYAIGALVATAISGFVPSGTPYLAANGDPTDLLLNSWMTGTAGTKGANTTGNVATSWSLTGAVAGGATIVGSKIARTGAGEWQQIVISGTYTGNNRVVVLSQTVDLTGTVNTGDTVRLVWEAELDSGHTALAAVIPDLHLFGGLGLIASNTGTSSGTLAPKAGPWSGTFVSQPFTFNAAAAAAPTKYTANFYIYLQDTATTDACAATVRAGRVRLYKV